MKIRTSLSYYSYKIKAKLVPYNEYNTIKCIRTGIKLRGIVVIQTICFKLLRKKGNYSIEVMIALRSDETYETLT